MHCKDSNGMLQAGKPYVPAATKLAHSGLYLIKSVCACSGGKQLCITRISAVKYSGGGCAWGLQDGLHLYVIASAGETSRSHESAGSGGDDKSYEA